MRSEPTIASRMLEWWARRKRAFAQPTNRRSRLQRLLLVATVLAGKLDPACAAFGRKAVRRTAFAADRLDPRIALLDDEVAFFHGFADQALGLFPHRLLRHGSTPVLGSGRALSTVM